MINKILMGIFNLIISLVDNLLKPLDLVIAKAFPSLTTGFSYVSGFFNWLCGLIPWATSWFGLNSDVLGFYVAYMTFELTVPLLVHTIKLCLSWYDKLKV